MAKIRVYELARELKIESKNLWRTSMRVDYRSRTI
jgi:hypothetical protein